MTMEIGIQVSSILVGFGFVFRKSNKAEGVKGK